MIEIRPLQEGDEGEWARLRCALWPDHERAELEREMAEMRADVARQPGFVAGKGLIGNLYRSSGVLKTG